MKTLDQYRMAADRGYSAATVLLKEREACDSRGTRYVVHLRNDDLGGCCYGFYSDDVSAAKTEFRRKIDREDPRGARHEQWVRENRLAALAE